MDSAQQQFEHDPRIIAKIVFDGAKRWWVAALTLKIAVAGMGIWFVFSGVTSALAPGSLAVIGIAAELCLWWSDLLKGRGEALKRKIEYQDAFGWALSPMDMSDHLARLPSKTRAAISKTVRENYFASNEAPGPKRAMENLAESAWWSKDLAGYMAMICSVVLAALLVGSIATLSVSISTIRAFTSLQTVSRVVTAVLSLIVSLGLVKLIVGYYGFGRTAERIERIAAGLLKPKRVDQIEAIKLLHEYQVARAAAPHLPEWIWKMRQPTLNDLWTKYRQGHVG
jgi:hypothetical protein